MFNVTLKYLSILNNTPTGKWVEHIAIDFLTCYSWWYYSSQNDKTYQLYSLHKNQRFPLRAFSVNVTKSTGDYGFGQISWRNL